MAQALLESFDLNGKLILADKGYDSDKVVRRLKERDGIVVLQPYHCQAPQKN